VLTAEHLTHPRDVFTKACENFGATLVECNGENGHVHLLVECPLKVPLTALMNSLKAVQPSGSASGTRSALTASTHGRRLTSPPHKAAHPLETVQQYAGQQRTPGG
jgi:putative transposase